MRNTSTSSLKYLVVWRIVGQKFSIDNNCTLYNNVTAKIVENRSNAFQCQFKNGTNINVCNPV